MNLLKEYIESDYFTSSSLRAIRKSFDNDSPVIVDLPEYPNKFTQVWASGKVEEVKYDDEGNLVVIEVLTTDYQSINNELGNLLNM